MGNLWLSLSSPLFRRAVAEAMLVGGVCGAVGVHVLLRRLAFFTHAAAHAAFPGVVLASLAGLSLFAGGAVGALAPLIGLTASAMWGLAAGAAVALAAVGMLALSALCVPVRHRHRGRRRRPHTVPIGHPSFAGPSLDSAPSNVAP
jgi:ABC-type Mn2+/Zn2+ transport system permease subunit